MRAEAVTTPRTWKEYKSMNIWIILIRGNVYGAFSTQEEAEAAIRRLSGSLDVNGKPIKPKLQKTFMKQEATA